MIIASSPHPPNDCDLYDLICECLHDERVIAKVLAENPAELYGFGPP